MDLVLTPPQTIFAAIENSWARHRVKLHQQDPVLLHRTTFFFHYYFEITRFRYVPCIVAFFIGNTITKKRAIGHTAYLLSLSLRSYLTIPSR